MHFLLQIHTAINSANGVIREMSMVSTLIYFKVVATLSLELIESTYFLAVSLGRRLRF